MPDKASTGEGGGAREPWIIRTYAGFGDARQANRQAYKDYVDKKIVALGFDVPDERQNRRFL
jgi:methylmalonyl-CoA mutase N-terminal domain/subunit